MSDLIEENKCEYPIIFSDFQHEVIIPTEDDVCQNKTFENDCSDKTNEAEFRIADDVIFQIADEIPKKNCAKDTWMKYIISIRDKFDFKSNKLVSNYKFYMNAPFDQMPAAKIKEIKGHPFRDYRKKASRFTENFEINISTKIYQTIEKGIRYLDGNIIDAVGSIFEKSWKNTKFIWAEQTSFIFNYPELVGDTWFMLHLNFEMKGKILLPYCHQSHWCLFLVDADEGTCSHINPYFDEKENEIDNRSKICFERFCKYLNNKNQKRKFGFKNKEWVYKVYPSNIRLLQKKLIYRIVAATFYIICIV